MADLDDFFKEIEELEAKKDDAGDGEAAKVEGARQSNGGTSTAATAAGPPGVTKDVKVRRTATGGGAKNPRPKKRARRKVAPEVVAVSSAPQLKLTVKDPLAAQYGGGGGVDTTQSTYGPQMTMPASYGATSTDAAAGAGVGVGGGGAGAYGAEQDPYTQQQSAYAYNPRAYQRAKERQGQEARRTNVGVGGSGERKMSAAAQVVARATGKTVGNKKKNKKFVRSAAGAVWYDKTLADWPEGDFRLFIGDIGNECTDEVLAQAFRRYKSFAMARVVMDKTSRKTKGYGFVSFLDPHDATKAMKEMNGKYVGNRPIKVRKSKWNEREITNTGAQRKAYQKLQKKMRRLARFGF